MNSAISSFKLIIVHPSQQEAQRLSSMFHNAGKPCRAQHINAEANLNKALEDHSWDLLIAYDNNDDLPPSTAIRSIRKFERDLPVIIITDDNEDNRAVIEGMKLGACDVTLEDDDQHLLLIVTRELDNRLQRNIALKTQRKLKEIQRRNQKLLDSSRDGIAFVQDGMYLYANDSFAEMLGHDDRDGIEFMPIMDNIDPDDHTHVKKTLKHFSLQKDPEHDHVLKFTALLPDGNKKEITAELFSSEYEEEPCTQLVCYAKLENQELIEAELQNIKHKDPLTGLFNRTHLIETVEKTVNYVSENDVSKAFIFIDIDRFSRKVKSTINITDTDILLKHIADIISSHYGENDIIARASDHSFAIIADQSDPDVLLETHKTLCEQFAEHLFEIGNKTLQMTLSIGICLINETTIDSQTLIHHTLQSIESLRKTQDGNGVNIYHKDAEEGEVLASSFKTALENDDFTLLFQPILSLRGEDTERYEVLLRMIVDDKEISPTQFLNIAHGLNLSTKIDRWVLLQAIKQLKSSVKTGKPSQQFINLTMDSMCDESLLPWLKVAIDASNIEPSSIVFQAREIDITQHLTAVKAFVEKANAIGIEFCITNFGGTSNDSLSIFEYVDAKYIKVDGGLSTDLQEHPENSQALEELIAELHARNKVTTIPHVERASILSKLWQLGVHCIQGNYLQPPSPKMDYEFSTEE